jgi:hypothetical protein
MYGWALQHGRAGQQTGPLCGLHDGGIVPMSRACKATLWLLPPCPPHRLCNTGNQEYVTAVCALGTQSIEIGVAVQQTIAVDNCNHTPGSDKLAESIIRANGNQKARPAVTDGWHL